MTTPVCPAGILDIGQGMLQVGRGWKNQSSGTVRLATSRKPVASSTISQELSRQFCPPRGLKVGSPPVRIQKSIPTHGLAVKPEN